ncbi:hypothetical protein BJ742DRAFT_112984 [Cladochytrium replicatum]|nr:hypothetical protein BJ742DRAFT_112984 [Cladochytrium replicatum]
MDKFMSPPPDSSSMTPNPVETRPHFDGPMSHQAHERAPSNGARAQFNVPTAPLIARSHIRVARACDQCIARKSRCSGDQPCSRCWERGVPCTFDIPPGRPGRPRTRPPAEATIPPIPSTFSHVNFSTRNINPEKKRLDSAARFARPFPPHMLAEKQDVSNGVSSSLIPMIEIRMPPDRDRSDRYLTSGMKREYHSHTRSDCLHLVQSESMDFCLRQPISRQLASQTWIGFLSIRAHQNRMGHPTRITAEAKMVPTRF